MKHFVFPIISLHHIHTIFSIEQPSPIRRGILRIVDWKSTIISDLFTFLIVDVFLNLIFRNSKFEFS